VKRWLQLLSFGLGAAIPLTALGYLLAQRWPGLFKEAFESQWDAAYAAMTLISCGVLGLGHGLYLGFSVSGAFQPDNLRDGAAYTGVGLLLLAVGGTLLGVLLT
jgi:hypothetical protein